MRLRFLLLPLLLLAACQETDLSKEAPIPPAKMEAILTDIHFAEIYSSMLADSLHQVQAKNLDSLSLYYKEIFAHHKITPDEFHKGLDWYRENPEMLDSTYKRIVTKIGVMETAGQPK
jgi:hypothetical protein